MNVGVPDKMFFLFIKIHHSGSRVSKDIAFDKLTKMLGEFVDTFEKSSPMETISSQAILQTTLP